MNISDEAVDAAAKLLAQHRIDHRRDTALHEECICGRRWMMGTLKLETHQAEVLIAAGFGCDHSAGAGKEYSIDQ